LSFSFWQLPKTLQQARKQKQQILLDIGSNPQKFSNISQKRLILPQNGICHFDIS
jgi:hypothetical protein